MNQVAAKQDAQNQTAVATRAQIQMAERGVRLTTLEEAFRFAQAVIKSGLAPKGITTPEQALIAIQAGAELGFSPMRALASVTVINGRAGLWGEAALAKIHQSGVCSRPPVVAIEGEGDERRGVVRFQRHDMPERVEVSFSIAEAKRAGLWGKGGAWSQYPDDMLGWRAVARMCKRYFGDVLLGLTVVEELRDYPVEPRAVAPPPEPDPLLVQPSNFGAPPIEAEVITEPSQARQQVPESGTQAGDTGRPAETPAGSVAETPNPGSSILPDEAELIRSIEKLEGEIVTADSIDALNAAWERAQPLLGSITPAEKKRLQKLYKQNAQNFGALSVEK